MLTSETALRIRDDDVAARVIDGEAIIMNLANGVYYSLDGVGAEMWTLMQDGHALRAIVAAISRRYGIDDAIVHADVERLAQELLAENLVGLAPANGGRPIAAPASDAGLYASPVLNAYRDMAELLALDPPLPGLRSTPWQAPSA